MFIDERSVQPSRDDVLPFLVCPAVEAMSRALHPWLILNPANETGRGPRVRPLSAARTKPARPGMACSDLGAGIMSKWERQRNYWSDCGCGVRHPVSRRQVTRSPQGGCIPRSGAGRCTKTAQVPNPCPVGKFLAAEGSSEYLSLSPTAMRRK
jgi:hypothetical protein